MALNNNKSTPESSKAGATGKKPSLSGRQQDNEIVPSSPFSIGNIRSGVVHSMFMKVVLGLLIAIFAAGFIFAGLGGNPDNSAGGPGGGGPDPVAQVGSQPIASAKYQQAYAQQAQFMQQFGQNPGPNELLSTRQRALDTLIQDAALYEAAQAEGITVSGAEIDAEINKQIDEYFKSSASDPASRRQLESKFGSVEKAKEEMRSDVDRDQIEQKLMRDKLEKQKKDSYKITEDDYKKSVTKLNLYQITLRPKFAPPTEKDPEAAKAKNAAEVKAKAEKLAAQLKGKPLTAFQAAAKKDSEDFMTKTKGGAVGWKLPNELPLPPEIRDAVVASNGQLVGPIQDENTKDQYLFFVAGRALKLPDDYNKKGKKEEYIKNFKTQRQSELWAKYQEEIKKSAKTEIYDPALVAFKMQQEQIYQAPPADQDKLRQEALAKYEEAVGSASGSMKGAIYFQMAQLYRDVKQPAKQVEALQKAVAENPDDNTSKIELARALRETGKKKEALEQLQKVSKDLDDAPAASSMFGGNPNDMLRQQVAMEYDQLGRKDLGEKERKKVQPAGSPGMGGMGMPGMPGGNIQIQ